MTYYVFGTDDRMYGPVDMPTLQRWVQEGRMLGETKLRSAETGEETTWAALDPSGAPPVPVGAYANPPDPYPRGRSVPFETEGNKSAFVWSLIDAAGGLFFFFVMQGWGFIWAGFGLWNSWIAWKSGHKYGLAAFVLNVVCAAALAVGWFFRLGAGSR